MSYMSLACAAFSSSVSPASLPTRAATADSRRRRTLHAPPACMPPRLAPPHAAVRHSPEPSRLRRPFIHAAVAASARRPYTCAACAPAPPTPTPTKPCIHATRRSRVSTPLAVATVHIHALRTRCSSFCLFEMGREKRKGKEVVVEKPVRKRTRAEREAERAEMVAKAAEEQASGHARPFAIRDPPARGRGRGRGMGRVRGARATTQQTEGDTSEGEPIAAESDHSVSDLDAAQSEQSQGQGT